MDSNLLSNLGGLFSLIFMLFLYFTPYIVARYHDHPSKVSILVINFFFGWTFVGWVIAVAWAYNYKKYEKRYAAR